MRSRAPLAAAIAAIVALAPALALPTLAATTTPAPAATAAPAVATAPKVVIVVGPVHDLTPSYKSAGDAIYAEAIKYTPNVVKLYSPNATWSRVKAAAQGASLFFYLGHGSGYPRTYDATFYPENHDGMGLNKATDPSDYVVRYYGESYVASELRFAKNAVVILKGLCYAGGSSQPGEAEPTVEMARERIDNFASGFLRSGARAVIADVSASNVASYVRNIFTTDQALGDVWWNAPGAHGNQSSFVPLRNPAYGAAMDPNTPTTGFYRSMVGAFDLHTTDVVAGAAAVPTGPDSTGADAAGPELWSLDGAQTISPNADGLADRLNLVARFSETASWSFTLRDASGAVVRAQSGSGFQAFVAWDATVGGAVAPPGDYAWQLRVTDAAGNPPLDQAGTVTVTDEPTVDTSLLSFTPNATTTNAATLTYQLTFGGPVSGLAKTDFSRTGTASKCVVGTPAGGPVTYTVQVASCTTGTVTLTLAADTVVSQASTAGPAGPISAPRVTIDRSVPAISQPRPILRTGVQLPDASNTAYLPAVVAWTGSDSGSGIAGYDVRRSIDGGAFQVIAGNISATSIATTIKPAHTYRFQVRARDRAGNVTSWTGSYDWRPKLTQQSSTAVTYTGTWKTQSSVAHSGGSARSASVAGASAKFSFTGRAVAWVTTLGPGSGQAKVYVDGVLVATIDTNSSASVARSVSFSRSWSSWSTHTIRVVVVGTATRPVVRLDAFAWVG